MATQETALHRMTKGLGIRSRNCLANVERDSINGAGLRRKSVSNRASFPRARWAGNTESAPPRELDGDALQIMLAYVAENDALGDGA